jgi:hypothetical protein
MVSFAHRVQSQARGAEILISNRAKQNIDEEKPPIYQALEWAQRIRKLKGFPGKHRLWSVRMRPTEG